VCLRKVDVAVAAVLPVEGLARRAAAEVLNRDGKLRGAPPYVARKLRATLKMDYGSQVPREMAERIAAEVTSR